MRFLSDTTTDGVRVRRFTLDDVTGALFSPPVPPPASTVPGPLVLLAHGGGQHAGHPAVLGRASGLVGALGLSVAALDAPGHGGRPRTEQDEADVAAMRAAMAAGRPPGPEVARVNAGVVARAVPEWRAVLDALLGERHADGPVGFLGLSLGAAIGVPLVADEPRIAAAVLGLVGGRDLVQDAERITVPVELVVQWDDEIVDRDDALALFAAFGSAEKSLHANPGRHAQVPAFERASAVRFLARHLLGREEVLPPGRRAEPA